MHETFGRLGWGLWLLAGLLAAWPVMAQDAPPVAAEGPEKLAIEPGEAPLTAEEVKEAVRRFTSRVGEFQQDIGDMVDDQYATREKQIDSAYEEELQALEGKELEAILAAIERLERFLALYPDEREYSPDAMFRLAELYFQKARREFDTVREDELAEYERRLTLFDEGLLDDEPTPPHPDFTRSIALYEEVANRFPDYRYIDAVYYLMAYAFQEQGNSPMVRRAFEDMIAIRPDSVYVAEGYLRIGDAYFNELNYEQALTALQKASQFKDSIFYDQILYKLASTNFILNRFDEAVRAFADLNDYSEKVLKEKGRHSYFRDESVKYIAYSYAQGETYWDKAGTQNAIAFFDQLGDRPWEADVFRDLGDYFVQQSKWLEAVASYKRVIAKDPYNEANPELQNKIIQIYAFGLRDDDKQNDERERLIVDYGEGSDWAIQNADNPDAVRAAAELSLNSLKQWATAQHIQAQRYRQMGREADAATYYGRSAKAYRTFLTKFPHDKEAYELNFRLAEALFFSGNYPDAVTEYLKVRDSKLKTTYFQDAAYAVVLCYDNLIRQEGEALTVSEQEAQAQQRERLKGETEKTPIPELKQKYIEAGDFYVNNTTTPLDQEKIAWNSAEILFENNHLEEARDRYIDIVNRFPKSDISPKAARRIIDTYTLAQDWVKVTEWSEKLASLEIGGTAEREQMRAQLREIRGNAMAQFASELEERQEYEKAAEQYLKAVEQDQTSKDAPAMLYNAAVNYSRAKRPAKAMSLFQRMVDAYPQAEFAAESLYFVAENAFDSFNLDRASKAYAQLYTSYPDIEPHRRCLSIYNHAQLKEFDHEYREAARIYEKYSVECEAIEQDAPIILFRSGELFEKLKDWRNMTRVYQDFIDRFGNQTENHRFAVQAYFKIGEAYSGQNRTRDAVRYYERAIEFFRSHPGLESDFLANQIAGQCQFLLVDLEFDKYKAVRIGGRSPKQIADSFNTKESRMYEIIERYKQVKDFKSPEYFLAASYRSAQSVVIFADALFDAPVPRELKKLGEEYVLEYQQQLSDRARPFYELAAKTYLDAFEEAKTAKLFGSPWMKRLIEALNHPNLQTLVGSDVKMRKPEKVRFKKQVQSPMPLDTGKPHVRVKPKETEPAEATEQAG